MFKNRHKNREILPTTSMKKIARRNNVALSLGGGGARGFAHIGVIKAFEENGIDFDFVVGTSAGSIIGAMYCSGMSATEMLDYADVITMKDAHNGLWFMPNDPRKIAKIVTNVVGDMNIEDLKKRFVAVSVDLIESKQVLFEKGDIGLAVAASCCVPLFFRPLIMDGKHLVDGGLLNNIPSDVARMLGASYVVASDINPTRGTGTDSVKTFEVLKATFNIMSSNSSVQGLINSDIIIAPDLSKFKATEKKGYKEMIELGYEAAMEKIPDIKLLMR